jgi:hypothetical protein
MTGTYEMIRALPAKGFDWTGFNAALRAIYVEQTGRNIASWIAQNSLAGWDAAKGMREVRTAAMEMACCIVGNKSRRQNIIAPSQESAAWDSFEGGHNDVWTDAQAEEAATQEVATLAASFRKMK